MDKKNPTGCVGCLFFNEIKGEKVCTEETQPKGSDGYHYLVNWDRPNDCELTKPKLVRQVKFRDDGSLTDVPAKDSEHPQLENQGSLDQWQKDKENFDRLKA